MANCARNLALLPERAYKLRVLRVTRQVNNWSVAADIEDGVVVVDVDLSEGLGRGKLLLDGGILEELD